MLHVSVTINYKCSLTYPPDSHDVIQLARAKHHLIHTNRQIPPGSYLKH